MFFSFSATLETLSCNSFEYIEKKVVVTDGRINIFAIIVLDFYKPILVVTVKLFLGYLLGRSGRSLNVHVLLVII